MITVDIHEDKHHGDVIEGIINAPDYEVAELPAGDYVIEGVRGEAIIERKEWTDFVSSYRTGALFNQLNRCQEQDHTVYVLIEGSRQDAINHAGARNIELRRMLTALHFKTDVQVIETSSIKETIQYVNDANDWLGQDPSDRTHNVRPAAKVPPEDRPRFIVEGLPTIGPKSAERLLGHFGTPNAVFSATEDELMEVDGVGPKTAEKILDALDTQHGGS